MLTTDAKRQAVGAAATLDRAQALQRQVRWMTYLMFFVFAMTTDAVGVIIPQAMAEYQLTMFQASAFHYVPMLAIGLAGLFLGRLADKLADGKCLCQIPLSGKFRRTVSAKDLDSISDGAGSVSVV